MNRDAITGFRGLAGLIGLIGAIVALAAGCRPAGITSSAGSSAAQPGLIRTISGPDNADPSSSAFSPDGKTLATADGQGSISLWNVATGARVATLAATSNDALDSVTFSRDGRLLAADDTLQQSAFVWDVATRKRVATFPELGLSAFSVALAPDGRTLAAADANGTVYLWSTASRALISKLASPGGRTVHSAPFSPDGKTLAAADANGSVYLWNVATRHLSATLTGSDTSPALYASFSPDGTMLAAAHDDGVTDLWDIATRQVTHSLSDASAGAAGNYTAETAVFSPDGRLVAVADGDGSTYVYDTNGNLDATLADPGYEDNFSQLGISGLTGLVAATFSPDGTLIAVASGEQHEWFIWNVAQATSAGT